MPPDFYFSPGSGQDWLTDGSFGAEGSIICTLVMLASILILAYHLRKSGKLFEKKSAEVAGANLQISYYAEFHRVTDFLVRFSHTLRRSGLCIYGQFTA